MTDRPALARQCASRVLEALDAPHVDVSWVAHLIERVLAEHETAQQSEPIDVFLSHWIGQGGESEFGDLDINHATNADGFVSEVLSRVRQPYRAALRQLEAAEARCA